MCNRDRIQNEVWNTELIVNKTNYWSEWCYFNWQPSALGLYYSVPNICFSKLYFSQGVTVLFQSFKWLWEEIKESGKKGSKYSFFPSSLFLFVLSDTGCRCRCSVTLVCPWLQASPLCLSVSFCWPRQLPIINPTIPSWSGSSVNREAVIQSGGCRWKSCQGLRLSFTSHGPPFHF